MFVASYLLIAFELVLKYMSYTSEKIGFSSILTCIRTPAIIACFGYAEKKKKKKEKKKLYRLGSAS